MHFPDNYYVGLSAHLGYGQQFPLGFATPDGTDAPAKKRKAFE